MSSDKDSRPALEKSFAVKFAKSNLSEENFAVWISMHYTARFHCHYGKVFVVWKHTTLGPSILDMLTVVAVHCDTYDGFSISFTNTAGESQWVEHKASKLFGLQVFAHIPFMPEISFLPKPNDDKHHQLKFPVVIKSEGNPRFLVEGDTYITQFGEFRDTYPQYGGLRPNELSS